MSRQMFCRPPLANRPAACIALPAGAALGVRFEATREDVCLDTAETARSVPQRCQAGGSTACRARRAVSHLAQ